MYKTLAVSAIAVAAAGNARPREVYEEMFANHVQNFGLTFKNGADFVEKLQNFANNVDIIEAHNAGNHSYKMGVNQFTHLNAEQFAAAAGLPGLAAPNMRKRAPKTHEVSGTAPASVDWSTTPAVSAVKNQGSCGSCWSFSATGGMEGAYYIKHNTGVSFSEQEFVSCDNAGDDAGCNGGWMDSAFEYAESHGNWDSESDYPYASGSGVNPACKAVTSSISNAVVTGYTDVTPDSDSALMSAIAQQPVSVAIQANQLAFQTYKSGVLTGNCGTRLDHGVLAVGYGVWTDGTPYWKVKNSWGTSWGMDGYVLIERGNGNQCGILSAASYPTM